MAIQTLDPVQVAFMNETIRPALEALVKFKFRADAFVLDYDNQQNAIATTADDIGDATDGLAPRTDAPIWTGTRLAQFRTLIGSMADTLDGTTLNVMIELMVRDLNIVTGGN